MSNQFSTGPAFLFVGTGANKAAQFLGTCEGVPRQEHRPEYVNVMNDLSGAAVPLDFSFQGMTALTSLTLTRWDEAVARRLENLPNPAVGSAGSWNLSDVGALMAYEAHAFPAWVVYPAATKAAYAALPRGYHYHQALVWSPMVIEPGTKPMKRQFLLLSWPKLFLNLGKWVLWDNDVAGLPAIN